MLDYTVGTGISYLGQQAQMMVDKPCMLLPEFFNIVRYQTRNSISANHHAGDVQVLGKKGL